MSELKPERELNAEERLKQLDAERKELKDKVVAERKEKKEKAIRLRKARDITIEKINGILKQVQKEIFLYNKLGKVKRIDVDILEMISVIVNEEKEDTEPMYSGTEGPGGDTASGGN